MNFCSCTTVNKQYIHTYLGEYPYARVSVIYGFLHHFVLAKLATSSISVKCESFFDGVMLIATSQPLILLAEGMV